MEITSSEFDKKVRGKEYKAIEIRTNYYKVSGEKGIKRTNLKEARDKVFKLCGLEYTPGDCCCLRYECGVATFHFDHYSTLKYYKCEITDEILKLFF